MHRHSNGPELLSQKMSLSQDITVNAAEVTFHVITAIENFIAVLFEASNGTWSHMQCAHVAQ